ncbi:ribosomal protein S5 domain 2-type protein [Hyaloraphidium curvatum]|nr:ribosomal protein S5 domain 2-type protein [Hyaloraphidium curvatum]
MDRKRITGPEASVRPFISAPAAGSVDPVVNPDTGARRDGRGPEEFRPLFLKTGVIDNAAGSAYAESGNLKIICAVYGPRQLIKSDANQSSGSLVCDFKFAPFSCGKRRGYKKDIQEKEFSLILEQALLPALFPEQFPKCEVDVFVTVLESDGTHAALSTAVTCASLALTDAGFAMRDVVVACSAGIVGDTTFLDCTDAEEGLAVGTMLLAHMPSINEVTTVVQTGELEGSEVPAIVDLATDACSQLLDAVRSYLVDGEGRK